MFSTLIKHLRIFQRFIFFLLTAFLIKNILFSYSKHPIFNLFISKNQLINNDQFDNLFLEPYLLPKEKKLFYKYLDLSHIIFEFGSGGFTHQAAKRRLKIYTVEISDSWHYLLKNEFEQIQKKAAIIAKEDKHYTNFDINVTYLLVELQSNLTITNKDRQKYVKIYNHTKYKSDFIVINGIYKFSCVMNIYQEIDKNTIIFLHGLEKKQNCSLITEYYDIIEQADRSFILKKKDQKIQMTKEVLKKVEHDDFRFKNKKKIKVSHLKKNFHNIYEKYKYSNNSEIIKPKNNNIWVFWYQGFDSLPIIVQMCIASIRKHFHNGNITYLDKNNYKQYAYMPKYIIQKFEDKKMTITFFSDILRSVLLSTHGGMWLDATIFVSGEIPSNIFNMPYFTIHCDSNFPSIMGKWTGFLQYSYANNIVPKFCMEALFAYWEKFDSRIDYLQLDIFFLFGYDYIPAFRRMIESVPLSNDVYDLFNSANDQFSQKKFNFIMEQSLFFKMSWKKEFIEEENGHKTIYGYLKHELLDK